MAIRIYIDGRIVPPEEAKISVFDRGFLYGDSVYEVLRTVHGRPLDVEDHLGRLARSAERLHMSLPCPRGEIEKALEQTLREASNPDSYVRIICTRGQGEIDLDPAAAQGASLIILAKPLKLPPPEFREKGVSVALVEVRRNLRTAIDPAIKSGNYLNNILALAEARARGAYEAVMCNTDGTLTEGTTSNIFVVQGGNVRTPALDAGLLEGITRRKVLELCQKNGISVREEPMWPDDLRKAEEAFITSSVRGVIPVTRVNGLPLGTGIPGALTRHIMALYDERLRLSDR